MPNASKRKPRPAVAPYLSVHDARKA
ncbi:MAG: hypothetical protein JWR07_406, partial [Nevskia sp.]|nr:hypothetical protein [Nevskia sp.]